MDERLHKLLAQHGIGSRRQVETWIQEGRISVNGRAAEIGQRVRSGDRIVVDGRDVTKRLSGAQDLRILLTIGVLVVWLAVFAVSRFLAVRRADEITISYTESRPAPGMMYAQMIVYPYDLVAVPAGARITFQLARTGPAQKSQAAEAPVRALDMTGFSPPTQARYVAFTDEAQWDAFWRSHGRCPAPKVAFQEEMVIGLLQPDDAPAVRLAGAQKVDNEVRLKLVSGSPEAGGLRSFLAVVPRANRVDLAWTRSSP